MIYRSSFWDPLHHIHDEDEKTEKRHVRVGIQVSDTVTYIGLSASYMTIDARVLKRIRKGKPAKHKILVVL